MRHPDNAADAVENLSARALIVTATPLSLLSSVWVAGEEKPFEVRRSTRGLNLGALLRENVVYNTAGADSQVDAALEMLAALQVSSPTAAIASGWAAIEALLSEPDDRGGAAERLATIVACSLPRAELTVLSYILEREDATMKASLCGVIENRDRAAVVARAIIDGVQFDLKNWTDKAAVQRMARILSKPSERLNDIQEYVGSAFRRLYRQRNLVLHGGRTNAVALRACLRTAAPLVGAGMDRIAHGYYVNQSSPLITAAQARIALTRVNPQDAIRIVDMLP